MNAVPCPISLFTASGGGCSLSEMFLLFAKHVLCQNLLVLCVTLVDLPQYLTMDSANIGYADKSVSVSMYM